MAEFNGMAWSHPRGIAPLRAASAELAGRGLPAPRWEARSLRGFEEASIAELTAEYDLIAIDHPFMGSAHASQALLPVDELLPHAFTEELRTNSVGLSWESYRWAGHSWAVPVDAAAQVAAVRDDLIPGGVAPSTWEDVFELDTEAGPDAFVGIPANTTHLLLAFATICHGLAGNTHQHDDLTPGWWGEDGIDPDVGEAAVVILRKLLAVAHPMSSSADPIELLDRMTTTDEIAYTPIAFGYSNYARPDEVPRPTRFTSVPSPDGHLAGAMLGGVGLAVSARCSDPERLLPFLQLVGGGEFQSGEYTSSGGQPAHRAAWTDPAVNTRCPGFFAPTLDAVDSSFVRPRQPWYPQFQREGGEILHASVHAGIHPRAVVEELRRYERTTRQAYSDQ